LKHVPGAQHGLPLKLPSATVGVLDDAARAAVWRQAPTVRGNLIQNHLAATDYAGWFHVGAEHGGFFPLIDFQLGRKVVSLKTADTSAANWKSALMDLEKHIRDLGRRGVHIDGHLATPILDLRVQSGGAAAANSLIEFGLENKVQVIIKEF
jgi:filamentous hemagglutinin